MIMLAPSSRALVVMQPQFTRVDGASIVMKSSGQKTPVFRTQNNRFRRRINNWRTGARRVFGIPPSRPAPHQQSTINFDGCFLTRASWVALLRNVVTNVKTAVKNCYRSLQTPEHSENQHGGK